MDRHTQKNKQTQKKNVQKHENTQCQRCQRTHSEMVKSWGNFDISSQDPLDGVSLGVNLKP